MLNPRNGRYKTLVHTGHFGLIINNSLKFSRHSHFELFFAVRYFRENMVMALTIGTEKITIYPRGCLHWGGAYIRNYTVGMYCRSGNFCVVKFSGFNFLCKNIFMV